MTSVLLSRISSFAFPFSRLEGPDSCDGEFNGDYDTSYCCLVVIMVLLVVAFDVVATTVVVGHVVAGNMVVRKHIVKSGVCCGKLKLADDVIVGDGELELSDGDGRCESCCAKTTFKSEYQGREWSRLVDNSTIENEMINIGYCMPRGARLCGDCCRSSCALEFQGRKWSFINNTIENEKIDVGNCWPKCYPERCYCCPKDKKCYEDPQACYYGCK
ncbi:hypothetical protein Tco_0425412 [Tanacetum coccineum]